MPSRRSLLRDGWSMLTRTAPVNTPSPDKLATNYIPQADPSLSTFVPSPEHPWDQRRVLHLLRRTGMGGRPEQVGRLLAVSPVQAVTHVVNMAIATPPIPKPEWADIGAPPRGATDEERTAYNQARNQWNSEFRGTLAHRMLTSGLHFKMTLFWTNHFVTEYNRYGSMPQYAYRYIKIIQDHQFGSFETLTRAMGLTPAMLIYLNGNANRKQAPNENYARELLELFTLGEGNGYTQNDITELARALTGYTVDNVALSVNFVQSRFDDGSKTIFGQAGNFDYDGALDVLFAERRVTIARHVCRSLYQFFVYPNAPQAVVDGLADIFLQHGGQIGPVLHALFASRHFFDDEFVGASISSPLEHLSQFHVSMNVPTQAQNLRNLLNYSSQLGQNLLQPPNVAGWPGHREWLNTSTLPARWNYMQTLVNRFKNEVYELAKSMPEPDDPYALARNLAEFLLPVTLTDDEYAALGNVMLGGTPHYEWKIANKGALSRVQALLNYIVLMPEYQLN